MVQRIQHWKYDDRLNYLGLMRLERRRVRSDLIETFKIMKGMYDVNKEIYFELDDSGRRGHDQKLSKKRIGLDVRKFIFSNTVVNGWNSLSSQCVNSGTVNTFKNIFQLNWNRKLLNYISCVLFEIVGVIWNLSLCLIMPAVSSTFLASVKSVKQPFL